MNPVKQQANPYEWILCTTNPNAQPGFEPVDTRDYFFAQGVPEGADYVPAEVPPGFSIAYDDESGMPYLVPAPSVPRAPE